MKDKRAVAKYKDSAIYSNSLTNTCTILYKSLILRQPFYGESPCKTYGCPCFLSCGQSFPVSWQNKDGIQGPEAWM